MKETKDEITAFIESNLEKQYYEWADELLLLGPITGLLNSWKDHCHKDLVAKEAELTEKEMQIGTLHREIKRLNGEIREVIGLVATGDSAEKSLSVIHGD